MPQQPEGDAGIEGFRDVPNCYQPPSRHFLQEGEPVCGGMW